MAICRVLYDDFERISEINKFAKRGLSTLQMYDDIEFALGMLEKVKEQKEWFQRLESESSALMSTLREMIREQEIDF